MLLFASPTISLLVKTPAGEQFSGLYILGPNHLLKDIPFNIHVGVKYSVYLGIHNEVGSSSYYTSIVKIRNETDLFPNATLGKPSSLPSLYEYISFVSNAQTWETPLTFQVNRLTYNNGVSQLSNITINGVNFSLNKDSTWNSNKTGYSYSLLVELWIFNSTLGTLQYHNRYLNLFLNIVQ